MKENIKTANSVCNFLKCIFVDLTVTGITDNDEKISVTTQSFLLKTTKINNFQKSWTSLIYTRLVVALFTEILIHKYNSFSKFKEEENASKDFIIVTFIG